MTKMKIYCVTNVEMKYLEKLDLNLAGVGNKKFNRKYITSLLGKNLASLSEKFVEDYTPLTEKLNTLMKSINNIKK